MMSIGNNFGIWATKVPSRYNASGIARSSPPLKQLQFHLLDIVALMIFVAMVGALRAWAIAFERETVIVIGIVVASVVGSLYLLWRGFGIFASSSLATLAAAAALSAWALECVFESPGTAFLRTNRVVAGYSADVELNAIATFVFAVATFAISAAVGWITGIAVRAIRQRKRRG